MYLCEKKMKKLIDNLTDFHFEWVILQTEHINFKLTSA